MSLKHENDYGAVPCCICARPLGEPFCLSNMPASAQGFEISGAKAKDAHVNMSLYQCNGCGLVQYRGPLVPYYREVIRSSQLSKPMMHFRKSQFIELINNVMGSANSIFELGCGDGEYLDIFADFGLETAGVEGSEILSSKARAKGHDVITGFLTETKIPKRLFEQYDIVTSFNFIEHLPDSVSSLKDLHHLVRKGGLALFEVPNYDMILGHGLFNEFIPDHRSYFTQETFRYLLSQVGFEVLHCDVIWDGYIISIVSQKRSLPDWTIYESARKKTRDNIVDFFDGCERAHSAVWSAGHQSLATISNLSLTNYVATIIDSAPAKQGKYAPASGLPIMAPEYLDEGQIRTVLLMAAGFNDEIAKLIRERHGDRIRIGMLNKGKVETDC